jgi:hypothetical protein
MKNDNIALTVSKNGIKISVELPWDTTALDLVNAFNSSLIGISFLPEQVENAFIQFLEEKEYYVSKYAPQDVITAPIEDNEDNEDEEFVCAETSQHVDPFILSIVNKNK